MEDKILENLVLEWFSLLDKGYAIKPYNKDELESFKTAVKKFKLTEEQQNYYLMLLSQENTETVKYEWFENSTTFNEFVHENYTYEGQQIENLSNLYTSISRLSSENIEMQHNILTMINDTTPKSPLPGKFKMDEAQKTLLELIDQSGIKVKGGNYSELWFALVYSGTVKGGVRGENGFESDVNIIENGYSLKNYSKLTNVDFGMLDPLSSTSLRQLIEFFSVLNNKDVNKAYGRDDLNGLIEEISNKKFVNDLKEFYNTLENISSKDNVILNNIKTLFESILEGESIENLPTKFVNKIIKFASQKVASVPFWGIIDRNKYDVIIKSSNQIIESFKPVVKNNAAYLPSTIVNFHKLGLWVNANKIEEFVHENNIPVKN